MELVVRTHTGQFQGGEQHPKWNGGSSSHPLYTTWRGIKLRCYNPNHEAYLHYGGRGIEVCEEWRDNFWAFAEYVGERPEGMTLDRINNDGNYEPGNVRWITRKDQCENRRAPRKRKPTFDT